MQVKGSGLQELIILGLNAYHGDASTVLLRDGEVVAAVEEERFRRGDGGRGGVVMINNKVMCCYY